MNKTTSQSKSNPPKMLELFCGLGGWSKGFWAKGYECYGVDNRDLGYPYNFIKADLFDWEPDQHYDIVCASPPCTEFSVMKKNSCRYPYDERIGLDLVYRAFYLIDKIKPKFWLIENVPGLSEFIDKPKAIVKYGKNSTKRAYLWGNFDKFEFNENSIEIEPVRNVPGWNEEVRALRGLIPIQLSRAIAEVMI